MAFRLFTVAEDVPGDAAFVDVELGDTKTTAPVPLLPAPAPAPAWPPYPIAGGGRGAQPPPRLVFCWAPYNQGTMANPANRWKNMLLGAATIHVEIYNPQDGCSLFIHDEVGKLTYARRWVYTDNWILMRVTLTTEQYQRFTEFVVDRTVKRTFRLDGSSVFRLLFYPFFDAMPADCTNCSRSVAEAIHHTLGAPYSSCVAVYTPDMTMDMLRTAAQFSPALDLKTLPRGSCARGQPQLDVP